MGWTHFLKINFLISFVHFSGFCVCDIGFIGSDCSQSSSSSSSSSPNVKALANFGLCDVRAGPCRDMVILGDGLVRDDTLNCVFEIYKVRT